MFQIQVNANKAWITQRETLTMYSTGNDTVQIDMDFGSEWDNLSKIAVFRAYDCQIDVAMTDDTVEIPVNVLLKPNVHLMLGIYGVNGTGTVVIPTVWADLGIIQPSPNPTDADNYGPPALDLYAQVAALAKAAQTAAETAVSGVYAASISFSVNASGHLIMTTTITEDNETTSTDTDLGAVSAYAAAVDAGYTGTYAQFKALLIANAQTEYNVDAALAAVTAVTDTANEAKTIAQSASATATSAASNATAASTAATNALTAVSTKQDKHKTATVTLPAGASAWTDLSCQGVTATNLVIWGPDDESFDAAMEAGVRMTSQGANTVSFSATSTTSEDIVINLAIFD